MPRPAHGTYGKTRLEKLSLQGQCGFHPGRSTTETLVRLENEIQCSFANKKKMLAVFLDMSRTFDRVWWPASIFKLKNGGISGNMLNWTADFF